MIINRTRTWLPLVKLHWKLMTMKQVVSVMAHELCHMEHRRREGEDAYEDQAHHKKSRILAGCEGL